MSLDKYFAEIESLEFQVQYSILSGFRSVREAMSRDCILRQLILELKGSNENLQYVVDRIAYLLAKAERRVDKPIDESVAAYLFCLSRVDLSAAHFASKMTLRMGGLWWSVQFALYIDNLVKQICESIDNSGAEFEFCSFNTTQEHVSSDEKELFVFYLAATIKPVSVIEGISPGWSFWTDRLDSVSCTGFLASNDHAFEIHEDERRHVELDFAH